MKTQKPKTDILRDIVHYHENAMTYVRAVGALSASFSQNSASVAWRNYYDFYTIEINRHFEFEENIVFPAVRAGKGGDAYKDLLFLLCKQHGEIKRLGAEVLMFFTANKDHVVENALPVIHRSLLNFAGHLKRHAELENEKLLPVIEGDSRVRFLMGRAFIEQRVIYKQKFAMYQNTSI